MGALPILASNWSPWNFKTSSSSPSTQMPLVATSTITAPSTVFASGIIGWVCIPTSNVCAMPAPVVPSQTPWKAGPPNWYTTSQSRCHSSSYSSMHTLPGSILALRVLRYIWLHAVVWLALLPWNQSSMQIPKFCIGDNANTALLWILSLHCSGQGQQILQCLQGSPGPLAN